MHSLAWMADVLRLAGLTVTETKGWQDRGHGDFGPAKGIMLHHTAGPLVGNLPSLNVLTNGRTGLKGPLCNLGLARDGTWYCIAAGRAYHAGDGEWRGVKSGNTQMIGIEGENTGVDNDSPWPTIQMDAYVRGVAALAKNIGCDFSMIAGHKEFAKPKGRKIDPSFNMDEFRENVRVVLGGMVPDLGEADKYEVVNITPPDTLNIRKTPNGGVIGAVPLGTLLDDAGRPEGKWRPVRTPAGYFGYVHTTFLDKVETVAPRGQ